MRPAARSPFLKVPEAEWVCANWLCFAIFDSFPVSPRHVLAGTLKRLLDERLVPKPDSGIG